MLEAKLVVVGGQAEASQYDLNLPALVGRGHEAAVNIAHPLVSRRHCLLYEENGQLFVRDLGSLNGTYVGRERVVEAALAPGQLLTVGTVTFRALYEQPAGAPLAGHAGSTMIGDAAETVLEKPGEMAPLQEFHLPPLRDSDTDYPPQSQQETTRQDPGGAGWESP